MAKELPYFQFEPGQYLAGNIQFCSYEEQGVFINICAIYWQRSCEISEEQLIRKYGDVIHRLIAEGVLKSVDGNVSIEFLDEQWKSITASKKRLSELGKAGAEKKWGATFDDGLTSSQRRSKRISEARAKGTHTDQQWNEMVLFFESRCVKCECNVIGNVPNKDHIIPIINGGSDAITNIQPLCRSCNAGKVNDQTDYRIIFCNKNNLKMPSEWQATPSIMASHPINNAKQPEEIRGEEIKEDKIKRLKDEFAQTLQPFKDKYPSDMLNAFYLYWTEPNKSMTKIKWQLEKTWDVSLRLSTWASRDKNFRKQEATGHQPQRKIEKL